MIKRTHTHTYTHTNTHTETIAHAHTQTHTNTQNPTHTNTEKHRGTKMSVITRRDAAMGGEEDETMALYGFSGAGPLKFHL